MIHPGEQEVIERELAAVLHSVEEFGCLFHDGEVGGEVHVVDAVEAEALDSGDHLAFNVGAGLVAEAFAEGSSDRRSGADSDVLCRVGDGVENLLRVVLLVEGADRAGDDTLTTADTAGLSELLLEEGSDVSVEAAVVRADDSDSLHILAGCDAAAAEYALVVVADEERGAFVLFIVDARAFEVAFFAAVLVRELLELTVGAADAGETLPLVVRENELEVGLACGENLRGVGLYFHALVHRVDTGRDESARSGDLDKAETAGADLVDVLEVAEGRDLDARRISRLRGL